MNLSKLLTNAVAVASLMTATAVSAQNGDTYVYDVKVVCGTGHGKIVAPGNYWTAINILNPNADPVEIRARVATALPNLTMGPLSASFGAPIDPNHAIEIDCPTVHEYGQNHEFVKGYVTIQSRQPLTIVAVYTQANRSGDAVSIDVERVSRRQAADRPGTCPDLTVDAIRRPAWDSATRQTLIDVVIANVGTADAPSTTAHLIDPSTNDPGGNPYSDTANTGPIPAGASVVVQFTLPYWVYNPDAALEVTADANNSLAECNEDNNFANFEELG